MSKYTLTAEFVDEKEFINFLNFFNAFRAATDIRPPSAPAAVQPLAEIFDEEEKAVRDAIDAARVEADTQHRDPPPTKPKRGRPAKLPTPAEMIAATAPEEPEPEPEPAKSEPPLPELEFLKDIITQAVRKAQKSEGPRLILDLLPPFKEHTGLPFISQAEEKHRKALYQLADDAGLMFV